MKVFLLLTTPSLSCTLTGTTRLNYAIDDLLRNETDILLEEATPFGDPNLDYAPYQTVNMVFLSAYNYSPDFKDGDLLESYLSFDSSYYYLILLSFFLFMFTWSLFVLVIKKMKDKKSMIEVRKARKPSYWIMICSILDQDQYPNISKICFTILSLCITLLFYLVIDCFMLSMINTNLVVINEPIVIRNYDDILRHESIKISGVREGSNEAGIFLNSEPGSKLWKVSKHLDLKGSKNLIELIEDIFNQKRVVYWHDDIIFTL